MITQINSNTVPVLLELTSNAVPVNGGTKQAMQEKQTRSSSLRFSIFAEIKLHEYTMNDAEIEQAA